MTAAPCSTRRAINWRAWASARTPSRMSWAAPLAIHCAASALISGVAISAKERIDASTCARLSRSGAST